MPKRAMILVSKPEFPVSDSLRLVALQGDCGLRYELSASGGRYVVNPADRAMASCLDVVAQARSVNAHLVLIPELAIPATGLSRLIEQLTASPEPLVLMGGIEGVTPDAYRAMAAGFGLTADIGLNASGTYVNAMVVVLHGHGKTQVFLRAKRFASGAENAGAAQMVLGDSEFLVLELGPKPFVIVPLICAEFTWPDLWTRLKAEVAADIDVIPVLQRNNDVQRRYVGPAIHTAYQKNVQTRFVLANQALSSTADGACYVVAPPSAPASPGFDHGRNELWFPPTETYKGFRVPERTGCIWSAEVWHPTGPMNAARPPVCAGRVLSVLDAPSSDMGGLPAGLMRSVAAELHVEAAKPDWASAAPRQAYQSSLSSGGTFILTDTTRESANECFYRMICDDRPTWGDVEPVVRELVRTAALLSSAGDVVRIAPCQGGNCVVSGKAVAVLYAPTVDTALESRFSRDALLSGVSLPAGVILLGVQAGSGVPHAKTVGDVLRADRVSSDSPELTDGPSRVAASAVSVGLSELYFCEPKDLAPNLDLTSAAAARARTSTLMPGVYA